MTDLLSAPDVRVAPSDHAPSRERADLELLTGGAAAPLLGAALSTSGAVLDGWSVHEVHHRPGVGVTVGYVVQWSTASARTGATGPAVPAGPTGTPRSPAAGTEYLLASTAPVPASPALVTAVVDGRTVAVWRHPGDPALPGLAAASSAQAVASALATADEPAPAVTLELVTYRPLRRAVLRARTPARTTYLKVVRPHTADLLHRRHVLLAEAGLPVAPSTLLPDGVLLLGELTGPRLTDALAADGAAAVPPALVPALLDRLPRGVLDLPRRRSWSEDVLLHARGAAAAFPERAEEIHALASRVRDLIDRTDPGPVVPTHGDLHEANLLVHGSEVVGLLDVDAVGPGHRVDDLACLLAHMSVLPALDPVVHRHAPAALERWLGALERDVDPVGLRARAAAVTLSLVAGARRAGGEVSADADGRLAAAHAWFDDARQLTHPCGGHP